MQRRSTMSKSALRSSKSVGAPRESRGRAVRALVFMTRLFEYECRDLDVTMAQYRLLLYLVHGPRRAGELASQASVTRPALSALIAGLEELRYIERSAVRADGRGVQLQITRLGLETIDRVEERFGRIFDDTTQRLDRDELVTALGGLCRQLTLDIEARARPE
jgi:DNA-binding MarR family transcriptional regulator